MTQACGMRFDYVLLGFLWVASAHAAPAAERTICTITVNSADEKEAFRRHLPAERYRFVELVEKGRPDWLRSACERKIACDVLVVSGHYNAGDVFYSDRLESNEYLRVDELERASCSDSCPALFSRLKEVYLFGCESLNPDASRYSSSHGDGGQERMRRIFAGVPVIYGFSGSAPVGAAAATLLERYFGGGAGEVGSGRRSSRLLDVFARSGMVATRGAPQSQAARLDICPFFDERLSAAQKLSFIHATMRRDRMGHPSASFKRIDGLFAGLTDSEKQSPAFALALAEISIDDATRAAYLAALRAIDQPALRVRMIALAATLGWLTHDQQTDEVVATINEILARRAIGLAEVAAICSMNAAGELDGELARVTVAPALEASAAVSASLACLGDRVARVRVLNALTSADERDVQVAQVYFRHRPAHEAGELLAMALDIGRMAGTGAQVRALDTLGRLYAGESPVADELMRLFAAARSVEVQRAIAEVFLRSGAKAMVGSPLANVLRRHRLASSSGEDLIGQLIQRLSATSTSSAS
jgi:hypothetical protein